MSADPSSTSLGDERASVSHQGAANPPKSGSWNRLVRIEVPIIIRAVAIVLIVATHADLVFLQGGAHLLLIIAGYNLARFQLANRSDQLRTKAILTGITSVAIPAISWIAIVAVVAGTYTTTTVLLVNDFAGSAQWSAQWHFWFLEALLWSMLGVVALLAIPVVRRWERQWPFAFALGVLAITLLLRTVVLGGIEAEGTEKYAVATVAWCVALGWVIARVATRTQRLVISAIALLSVVGFFGQPLREALVIGGVLVLLWIVSVPLPRWLVSAVSTLAGASLFTYLTHWQIYPGIETYSPLLATVTSLIVGVVAWKIYTFSINRGRALLKKVIQAAARTR
jgi:peptidoglycan/LPS O-acetylase OafA/YrhL